MFLTIDQRTVKVQGSKKNNIDGKKKKQNVDKEKDMEDRTWYDIFFFCYGHQKRAKRTGVR